MADSVLPFTKEPAVQADIRRVLRETLANAEAGGVEGIFLVTLNKDGFVSVCLGEQRLTMFGAVWEALVRYAGKRGDG